MRGRVLDWDQWHDRRRHHSADVWEKSLSSGRRDYSRQTARGATTSDEFAADGSALAEWASRHLVCCRKVARRVLALAELNRADHAVDEAHYLRTGWQNKKHASPSSACIDDLNHALARYREQWQEDFDPWWMSRPSVQARIAERKEREVAETERTSCRSAKEAVVNYASVRHMVDELIDQGSGTDEIIEQVLARSWRRGAWDSLFGHSCRLVSLDEYRRVIVAYAERVGVSGGVGQDIEGVGVERSFERDSLLLRRPKPFVTSTFESDWGETERMAASRCWKWIEASPYLTNAADFEPMMQEARVAVWEARKTFGPYGSARFSTYASAAIKNHLFDYVLREHGQVRPGELMEKDVVDSSADPALLFDGGYDDLMKILRRTPHAELLILHAAGVDDEELGNPSAVRQRRKRASDKILAAIAARN